ANSDDPIEVYEDGKMSRDFVVVSDVVEAVRRVTGNQAAFGQVLNVGTGQGVTLHEIAVEMFRALSKEPRIKVSGRYRSGDIRHAIASVSKLQERLGFVPHTPFSDGLRSFVEWAREHQTETADDLSAENQLAARQLLRQAVV
ncbi:MAG TPA: GDP-mannose 4,6-dehydratase, partial [Pyrinomonadaceae bacterium]|nr:GDP-mannose 4,6-dehydratase [Pyrinomonadaceae bacterium]